jgi:UDP-N-acetyl-alpha-D-quinovosamine dehydrogenase
VNILVTGANGFIGRHLCVVLAEVGCAVTALSRSVWEPPPGRRIPAATLRRIRGVVVPELAPETDFGPLLAGQEAVVHLAGRAHVLDDDAADPRREFQRVNVGLTVALAEAAIEAGVTRFLYVSSIGVLGNRTTGAPFDRNSPAAPLEAYAASKLEAERRLRELFDDPGRTRGLGISPGSATLTVVRPPLVYGPGAKGNFERLMKLVDRVPVLPFGAVRARRSYVHVLNLCSFLYTCLRHETESGTYTVCDGEHLPLNELLRIIAAEMRKTRWLLPLPAGVLRLLGSIVGRRDELDRLTSELLIDNRDEKRQTGWEPAHSPRDGLRAMVREFQRKAA